MIEIGPTPAETALLDARAHIAALEQLLEVYEQTVS